MRHHIIRYHIADERWWFLFPLACCWKCRRWEIAVHVNNHGPFSMDQHLQELVILVDEFIDYLSLGLGLGSSDDLLNFVERRSLGDANSIFSPEELELWDNYDTFIGLPKETDRNLVSPSRVSSLLHWRTLQRIFMLLPKTPNPQPTEDFADAHCHVDRLLHITHSNGTLSQFMKTEGIECQNLRGCVAVFCDEPTFSDQNRWLELVSDSLVHAAVGYHPKQAASFTPKSEQTIRHRMNHPKVCALGEIGLDYSGRHIRTKLVQQTVYKRLLKLAVELDKPIIVHCRDAEDDCLKIAIETIPRNWKIHLHCFSQDWGRAQKWLAYFPNLFIGLTLLVSGKNAGAKWDSLTTTGLILRTLLE